MRKLLFTIASAVAITMMAQIPYPETAAKAGRAFADREWASASALYNFMIHERPADAAPYAPAIVAAQAMGDTIRPMALLRQAMQYNISLDTLLSLIRQNAFAADTPQMYERFVLAAQDAYPWMRRPLDARLLQWAQFRNDGPAIIRYARTMLQGMPTNPRYLDALASGYILVADTTQAIDAWEKALAADPDNLDALLALGNLYQITGRRALALPYLQKAYALKPTPRLAALIRQ